MAKGKISTKQREILDYIKSEILKRGYPPSVREICDAVGLKSTSSVHSHLETLEKNGYIRRDPTKPRAIEITDDIYQRLRLNMTNIPIIDKVAAGVPLLDEQNIKGYFPIPSENVPKADVFAIKAKDDSMSDVGICKGDSVFVRICKTAKNDDTVVVLVNNTPAIKKYYKEKGQSQDELLGKVFAVFHLCK